jgi:hypothetical protein
MPDGRMQLLPFRNFDTVRDLLEQLVANEKPDERRRFALLEFRRTGEDSEWRGAVPCCGRPGTYALTAAAARALGMPVDLERPLESVTNVEALKAEWAKDKFFTSCLKLVRLDHAITVNFAITLRMSAGIAEAQTVFYVTRDATVSHLLSEVRGGRRQGAAERCLMTPCHTGQDAPQDPQAGDQVRSDGLHCRREGCVPMHPRLCLSDCLSACLCAYVRACACGLTVACASVGQRCAGSLMTKKLCRSRRRGTSPTPSSSLACWYGRQPICAIVVGPRDYGLLMGRERRATQPEAENQTLLGADREGYVEQSTGMMTRRRWASLRGTTLFLFKEKGVRLARPLYPSTHTSTHTHRHQNASEHGGHVAALQLPHRRHVPFPFPTPWLACARP